MAQPATYSTTLVMTNMYQRSSPGIGQQRASTPSVSLLSIVVYLVNPKKQTKK